MTEERAMMMTVLISWASEDWLLTMTFKDLLDRKSIIGYEYTKPNTYQDDTQSSAYR